MGRRVKEEEEIRKKKRFWGVGERGGRQVKNRRRVLGEVEKC